MSTYLAGDFGGGSGRVIAGRIETTPEGKLLVLKEIHRFENYVVEMNGTLYWDFPMLLHQLKQGLVKAAREYKDIAGIGIDTWGVDFGLIDSRGNLIGNPICYRDAHTLGEPEQFSHTHNVREHYSKVGVQMLSINTLYRLLWMAKNEDPRLKIAKKLLFMPDLFGYFLTDVVANEYTISSTSEMLDAKKREWDKELISSIGVDPDLFSEIKASGTELGPVSESVREETGLNPGVKVINVGSHDTASAIYGALSPDEENEACAFLSSGTWSLLGIVSDKPILTESARESGYTNEGGVGEKITFLTNITGLWILQRLKAQWENEGETLSWNELIKEAEESANVAEIHVDDPCFQNPHKIQQTIEEYCQNHGLAVPASRGEFVRCVCESLATRYKKAIEDLNRQLREPVKKLKIFGGGSQNDFLNRLTEEKTGLKVEKGPVEATAIGNILVQAMALGEIKDKSEIKGIKEIR